jgi:hypothetical protein
VRPAAPLLSPCAARPLTPADRHKAIIAYLGVINAPNTAAAFREEANVSEAFDDATCKKYEGLLEKKWTSVVRLQKKVAAWCRPYSRTHRLSHPGARA